MGIPADFQFSQASLQAFVDCPRLFELRYILRIAWPTIEGGPAPERERRRLAGLAFHRLVSQENAGVPTETLSSTVSDGDLARWWSNYVTTPPANLPRRRYAEISLSAPIHDRRLVAKYDLLAVQPNVRAVIVDWKTYRSRPDRDKLAARLQTRVYPYLLCRAGHELNEGRQVKPDQVEMTYWFADHAANPQSFAYGSAQYQVDEDYLTSLIRTITSDIGQEYPKTDREGRCAYCQYGPLCDRGTGVESAEQAEDEPDAADDAALNVSFDFEQIAEIEY